MKTISKELWKEIQEIELRNQEKEREYTEEKKQIEEKQEIWQYQLKMNQVGYTFGLHAFVFYVVSKRCALKIPVTCEEWRFRIHPPERVSPEEIVVERKLDGYHIYLNQESEFRHCSFLPPTEKPWSFILRWFMDNVTVDPNRVWIHSSRQPNLACETVPSEHVAAAAKNVFYDLWMKDIANWKLALSINNLLACKIQITSLCDLIIEFFYEAEVPPLQTYVQNIGRDGSGQCFIHPCTSMRTDLLDTTDPRFDLESSLFEDHIIVCLIQKAKLFVTCSIRSASFMQKLPTSDWKNYNMSPIYEITLLHPSVF